MVKVIVFTGTADGLFVFESDARRLSECVLWSVGQRSFYRADVGRRVRPVWGFVGEEVAERSR
jgi:hypothetical protein